MEIFFVNPLSCVAFLSCDLCKHIAQWRVRVIQARIFVVTDLCETTSFALAPAHGGIAGLADLSKVATIIASFACGSIGFIRDLCKPVPITTRITSVTCANSTAAAFGNLC